jgi:dienelactone hydrolase
MSKSHFWRLAALAFAAFIALSSAIRAADFYTEDLRIPMAAAGPHGLEALLMRPRGPGKYPLALISHGTPRIFDDRADMTARNYHALALEFAKRGFAALVVLRRGYGTSPGGKADSYGSCDHPDYRAALAVSVTDLQAAIAAMKARSDVATDGMIAIGHSAGGLATVGLTAQAPAAARSPSSTRPPSAGTGISFFPSIAHRRGRPMSTTSCARKTCRRAGRPRRRYLLPLRSARCRRRHSSAKTAETSFNNTKAAHRTRLLQWHPMDPSAGAQSSRRRPMPRAKRCRPAPGIQNNAASTPSTTCSRIE